MQTAFILKAIAAIHQAILANESQIESLDREIGDGDHYINMKRGCASIANMSEELANLSPDAALNKIGMKLLSTIGGASGPLFASFFISMGKTLKENGDNNIAHIAVAFAAGVQAIMQRGKADLGEKTMLDVLIPVSRTFTTLAVQSTDIKTLASTIKAEAEKSMLATKNMIATKGRAAGLGERTVGHIDAGAKSCQVMIEAVCNLL
ncbi:MAG TPA: dihydroxyacetone kinase subunit DhaL [Methylophilaceae bacterium]|jgi:dihydroxyacetone kinase-like protein